MKKIKLLCIPLLFIFLVSIFTSCQPKEVFLTTSNVSDYLDISVKTTQKEGMLKTNNEITFVGKKNVTFKDVEITYRLESDSSSWLPSREDTIKLAQDGCMTEKISTTADLTLSYTHPGYTYDTPNYTFEIYAISGSVLIN